VEIEPTAKNDYSQEESFNSQKADRLMVPVGSHVRRIENAIEGRVEQIVTHGKEPRMLCGFLGM